MSALSRLDCAELGSARTPFMSFTQLPSSAAPQLPAPQLHSYQLLSSAAPSSPGRRCARDGARATVRCGARCARYHTVAQGKQAISDMATSEVARVEASAALCAATLQSSDIATGRSQPTPILRAAVAIVRLDFNVLVRSGSGVGFVWVL